MPRKRIPWIKYFFQFVLPTFLFSMKATAQGKVVTQGDTVVITSTAGLISAKPVHQQRQVEKQFSGTVVNKNGKPIPDASVIRKGKNKGVATNRSGKFRIRAIEGDRVLVSAPGFEPKEVAATADTKIFLTEAQPLRCFVGGISVVYQDNKSNHLPLIKRVIDTTASKFSFYPNPLRSGSSYSIDAKKLAKGDYMMAVVDNNGAVVQTSEVSINTRKQVLSGTLPLVAAGNYYIRLTNKKTGAFCSNKIVVQ